MIKPAVLIVVAALIGFGHAQNTTVATATTTAIYSGSNVPITSFLSQTTVTSTFSSYFTASGLITFLNNQINIGNTYTLLVPINSAWSLLNSTDQTMLSNCLASTCSGLGTIVRYHIMRGTWTSSTLASCGTDFGDDQSAQQCATLATQGSNTAHLAVVSAGGSLYVNGAQVVLANLAAQNFTVHFISKWLYPVDTTTTANAFVQSALSASTATSAVVSTTCFMCSYTFANLWYTAVSAGTGDFQNWALLTASAQTGAVTMFVPYTQMLSTLYSINTLASMIQAMINSGNSGNNANLTALSQIAALHVIPNKVLFLNTWIANGYTSYPCGITTMSTSAYSGTCTLVVGYGSSYAIEVRNSYSSLTTGATIIYPDIPVENGVVHIVSNVVNYVYGNLWSIVQTHPQLTKFRAYVANDPTTLAYLQSTSASYTLFAPDDSSWSTTAVNTIGTNATLITQVLQAGLFSTVMTYSAIRNLVSWSSTVGWSSTSSIQGNKLRFVMTASGIQVDGGIGNGFTQNMISQPDLGASNGILHVYTGNVFGVASMTIAQFLTSRTDLTSTAYYLGQMSVAWGLLTNGNGPYSVFAPNNAAWTTLSQNTQLSALLSSASSAALANLLTRHYAGVNEQLYNDLVSSGSTSTVKTISGTITFTAVSMSPIQFQVSYGSVSANVNVSDYVCTNGRVHVLSTVLAVSSDVYNLGASCQNPATCSATSLILNSSLLLLGIALGLVGRR